MIDDVYIDARHNDIVLRFTDGWEFTLGEVIDWFLYVVSEGSTCHDWVI